ncbi:TetR/AcrR family transcriptional regulator [soil metagenome]
MTPTRRRGAALEEALLSAALDELLETGYSGLTIERVAERAGTSRHVVYRRWGNREELVLAALKWDAARDVVEIPDTGSLRGDVLAALRAANARRIGAVAIYSVQLGSYFRDTGTSLAELRADLLGDRPATMQVIIDRAAARGELDPSRLPRRVLTLPSDLLRHEALMLLGPVPDETIVSIVDEVFLPLVLRD